MAPTVDLTDGHPTATGTAGRRTGARRYGTQIVILMTEEDGVRLKDASAELGISQAELARRAIRAGYTKAVEESRRRPAGHSVIPAPRAAKA